MKNFKVGDTVKIVTGREKGKITKIKAILRKTNKVILENTNIKVKHIKPTRNNEVGKIIQIEAPIDGSNVMLCDTNGTVTRLKKEIKNGIKIRVGKKFNLDT